MRFAFLHLCALMCVSTLMVSANANDNVSASRNNLFSFGGIYVDSSSGDEKLAGFAYNTESLKGSLSKGPDTLSGSLAVKLNVAERTYGKAAFGYTDHDYAGNVNSKNYSGSLGLGYLVRDDLYIEAGGGKSKQEMHIDDQNLTSTAGYSRPILMSGNITDTIYVGATKRFETQMGTVDVRGSVGRIYPSMGKERDYYTAGMVAYPKDNMRIGYTYNYMQDNISNHFFIEYGYLVASYSDALNRDYQVATLGVQFAFTDMLNVGTYSMPRNIKRHISE